MDNIIPLEDQVRGMPKDELKQFIRAKYDFYKSSPEGCLTYIQECLKVAMPGIGYMPFTLWDTQKRMITDIIECMFDNKKDMYVVLGSRQCGKTTCMLAISDWLTTFFQKYNVVLIHVDDTRGKATCEEFRKLRKEKTKLMFLKPTKNALTDQIFQNESSFRLQSAQKSKSGNATDTGRGLSVNMLWIDEAAAVDLERLEAAVFPTTSTTFMFCKQNNIPHIILLTSTANGRVGIGKKYYDLWKQVEPPLNKENPSMGGYFLFWKDIPGKDQAWYDSQARILSPRKLHQEVDCVFFGTEQSLFTDEQVTKIQTVSNNLKVREPNYSYVTPSGYIARGTFFHNIVKGASYLIGVDMAKGRGQDSTTIEAVDYTTLEQVFEFKDNKIQHNDFVSTFNNVIMRFLHEKANVCISIEDNITGTAVINDLIAMNPMYKTLIYRDTISADISKRKNANMLVPYSSCSHGVKITQGTRDLLIDNIFAYVEKSLETIHSKELVSEIESLEIDKDGRIEGHPHDDLVFAFGHCLLVKNRGRISNVLSIFRFCCDMRSDPSFNKQAKMYLSGHYTDEQIAQESFNDNIFIQNVGFLETAGSLNNMETSEIEKSNSLAMNLATGGGIQLVDGISDTSLANLHEMLQQQAQFIKKNHPPAAASKHRMRKDSFVSDEYVPDETSFGDPALSWISMIRG